MKTFLARNGYPQGLDEVKRRQFRLKSISYAIIKKFLCRKDFNGALLRCIDTDQVERIVKELRDGLDGGHFSVRATGMKIMRDGY